MSERGLYDYMVGIGADDERLEQVAELLEACKSAFIVLFGYSGTAYQEEPLYKKMVEAISKAEGK